MRWGLRGIPAASEDVMVARDLLLARAHRRALSRGAHLHAQRRGHGGTTREQRGLPVTCEATPHHFALTDAHMAPYDSNYKMKPPLRTGLRRGRGGGRHRGRRGDAIATDHAPHPGSEKMQEFENCPFGIIGLETALGLALEAPGAPRQDSRWRAWWSCSPPDRKRVLHLGRGTLARGRAGRRDHLQHGSGVDLRREPVVLESRNSPFHGRPSAAAPWPRS